MSRHSARPGVCACAGCGFGPSLRPWIWLGLMCAALGVANSAKADWTAINDQGQAGSTNDTAFTIPALGANAGQLKDIATGTALGARLTITVGGGGRAPDSSPTMSAPPAGTPAYSAFYPFINWTGGSIPGVHIYPTNVIDYAFSGLDPAQRYRFIATAVRGGTAPIVGDAYSNRWTQAELVGVVEYDVAHSVNIITSNDFPAALTRSQAAWNAGVNLSGGRVEWDNIAPASNGTFTVRCSQYLGPIPGGSAANAQASYALQAIRLDEIDTRPLVQITNPTNNAQYVLPTNIVISALVFRFPSAVTNVQFFDGLVALGGTDAPPYSVDWAFPPPGLHQLSAVAWDDSGLSVTSAAVNIVVASNGPPSISLTSPIDGSIALLLTPLAVNATVSDGAEVSKVDFFVNGTKIGEATNAPYDFAWAGSSVGSYQFRAVATDSLGLTVTSGVAHVTITNQRSGPGTVYLVMGSDTAIWNAGTTVDVYARYPYYPQTFFTDPTSPSFQVMNPVWRNQFKDSFDQPVKFTWWLMGGNIYRDATNQNVPIPNTMVPYLMLKYQGAAIRQFGDEVSLHYHTYIWSDYNGDGKFYWNQSRTFEERREDFEYTLAQYLLEEGIFPVSFRSGWHYMDNSWQQELDQLLPYSLHDDWPADVAWSTAEPVGDVQDWSRAPSVFVPFHPATNDYQVPGTLQGWNLRSIKMQSMVQSDMNSIFAHATNGADQVVCIWDHLPEAFVTNFQRIASFIQLAATNHPGVAYRFCTAVEGMQRWQGIFGQSPPEISVDEATQGQTVVLTINITKPLFQPKPFVALRDAFGQYTNLTASSVQVASNSWTVLLPVPRNVLAKVGIAATDRAGNLVTRILRYLPDDLYIDNLDSQYAELSGSWSSTTNSAWGTDARVALLNSNDTARVQWMLPVSRLGFYSLSVQVPAVKNAARNIAFHVYSGDSDVYSVAFPGGLPGNQWVALGSARLDPALTNLLEMVVSGSNQPGTRAVADVVRMVPLPDATLPPTNQLAISPTARGVLLLFAGQSSQRYDLLRSTNLLTGWTAIATVNVSLDGLLVYEDTNAPPVQAFYRVMQQGP
jgi:hypothetical protein